MRPVLRHAAMQICARVKEVRPWHKARNRTTNTLESITSLLVTNRDQPHKLKRLIKHLFTSILNEILYLHLHYITMALIFYVSLELLLGTVHISNNLEMIEILWDSYLLWFPVKSLGVCFLHGCLWGKNTKRPHRAQIFPKGPTSIENSLKSLKPCQATQIT